MVCVKGANQIQVKGKSQNFILQNTLLDQQNLDEACAFHFQIIVPTPFYITLQLTFEYQKPQDILEVVTIADDEQFWKLLHKVQTHILYQKTCNTLKILVFLLHINYKYNGNIYPFLVLFRYHYLHWRRSALNSAGALQGGAGNFGDLP